MPSSPKIQKEVILNTALEILIHEGYSAINIKRIAGELGCSTQPISWQFGGMDGFRKELAEYAMSYAQKKMIPASDNFVAAFAQSGQAYIDLAIDEPNLFRFVFMGESGSSAEGGFEKFLSFDRNIMMMQGLMELLHITQEQANAFMNTMIIYTHGMASLIASGIVKEDKETAHRMVVETGISYLRSFGLSEAQIQKLFQPQSEHDLP